MSNKPQPKKEMSLDCAMQTSVDWSIYFYASEDAAADVSSFGNLKKLQSKQNWYLLEVNKRFDFQEVVDYIQNYG